MHDYTGQNGGSALLFQRLIELTPRWNYVANPERWEHPSKPYIEPQDTEDWRLVTITEGAPTIAPRDIPAIRALAEGDSITLNLPRVGFYTTPAFLGLWRTNDSNQHRVTANQTPIAAVGRLHQRARHHSRHGRRARRGALGHERAVLAAATRCSIHSASSGKISSTTMTCATILADNRAAGGRGLRSVGRRPKSDLPRGGALAFENINQEGADMDALGPLLASGCTDAEGLEAASPSAWPKASATGLIPLAAPRAIPSFGASCRLSSTVTIASRPGHGTLSSPLATGFSHAATFDARNVVVSGLGASTCAALGNRLDGDACGLDYAFPQMSGFSQGTSEADTVKAVFRIAGTIAADAFSRGSEVPVTLVDPHAVLRGRHGTPVRERGRQGRGNGVPNE